MDRSTLPIFTPRDHIEPAISRADQSPPYPARAKVTAPDGAPNLLIVLLDDMGFGASSAFGGPCRMPVAEELAEQGLRYSRFHTIGVCSPTRASLMSGRNHHSVGVGNVTSFASSSPGYDMMRPPNKATLAQALKYNGYATAAFGKWHQLGDWETSDAGPFDRWPTGEGFDKFYGFHGGECDQFTPNLIDGTTRIGPPQGRDDYHLSEDLVDQAQTWIRSIRSFDPEKPWFTYLSFGATHAPFQVPESWRGRHRGEFGHGWHEQRHRTLARQKELGLVPADAELPAWLGGLANWDELSDADRQVAESLMELYADFAEHTDAQVGRLVDYLRESGELDNTLIFYVLGDNGASPGGGRIGTSNEMMVLNGFRDSGDRIIESLDELGGPKSYPLYSNAWAYAMNTPYQWTKLVASHYGGTRNGLIVHWPDGVSERGGVRDQWHHVIDIAPTILAAAGIPEPEFVNGIEQSPMEGVSMQYSFNAPDAAEEHTTQYFELFGNRGVYHEGWTAVTVHKAPWDTTGAVEIGTRDKISYETDRWELYDTSSDWTQAVDVAAQHPEKLAELQELFLAEARKYQVLPMDDRGHRRPGDPHDKPFLPTVDRITLTPADKYVPEMVLPRFKSNSFAIRAEIEVPASGGTGVIISQGGRFGGWSMYLDDGHPVFVYNRTGQEITATRSETKLTPGSQRVRVVFAYDGGGFAKGGDLTMFAGAEQIASGRLNSTVPFVYSPNESTNVGRDLGSPVCDYPGHCGQPFDGTIHRVELEVLGIEEQAPLADRIRAEMTMQ